METSAILAFSSLCLFGAAGAVWLLLLSRVRVAEGRSAVLAAVVAAAAGALAAIGIGGVGAGAAAAAWTTLAGSAVFLVIAALARQADRQIAVRVGGPILPFIAADADGAAYDLGSMAGHRFLLKFFRGHW